MEPSDEDATVPGISWSQNTSKQNWSLAWYEKEKAGKAHGLQDVFNSFLTSIHAK